MDVKNESDLPVYTLPDHGDNTGPPPVSQLIR